MGFEMRQVGQTKVQTTVASFGCASIGNLYQEVSDKNAFALLEDAYASGIRYFDTAPHYGRGRSEQRLGQFLRAQGTDVVVSTKVGRVLSPGSARPAVDGFINPLPNDVHYDYSAEGIARSLEGSQKRLGRSKIDIVYVHDIGRVTHGTENDRHMDDLLSSGLPYLKSLQRNGDIRAVGLGVNENEVCLDVMKHFVLDVILLAGRWTLLDRSAESALVPLCRDAGTSLVLGGIFNSGILATGPKPGATFDYVEASDEILAQVSALQSQAQNDGLTLADAAVQFALTRDPVCSVLIGTGKQSSLRRNLTSFARALETSARE
jgi:D-threo-aldose 1-dehydrogenase